ncbi:SwmB domain-containing protein [Paenibacillus sp. FSL K6-2524]|uniref:SwmB domain-containing protein n=1 Tax=Paenibacillus sp. FSL K6-2524 TaxID=2954516 RepID=UPI0030FA79DC
MKMKVSIWIVMVLLVNMMLGANVDAATSTQAPAIEGSDLTVATNLSDLTNVRNFSLLNEQTGAMSVTQATYPIKTSFSPERESANASVSGNLVITFDRNVALNSKYGEGIFLKQERNDSSVAIDVKASGRQVIISPVRSLEAGTRYYVEIARTAIGDAENPTVYTFAGLSRNEWVFQTVSSDKTAPILQGATMYSNTTIRLRYDERLNSSYNLLLSNFTVTVNGETRRLNNVYTSGESVYIVLETGVAVGQNVRVSYSGSGYPAIQDEAGNVAASISGKEVINGIDSVMPKPKEGHISGSTLTLYFNESLKSVSSYAYQQFTVTADGASKGIDRISQSSTTITLYLSSSVSNGDVVKVSYSPGSYPLQDYRGMDIAAFNDFLVRNYNDTRPPEFTGVEGSGNKVILTYNEALRTSNIPLKSYFSVLVNNTPVYVTSVEIVSNQVILTLASSFTKDQNVTLSYVSGIGGIADLNGNMAGYINLQPITYNTVIEGIRSATITGDTLTIAFNSTLRTLSYLPANQFYVNVDKGNRGLQSATISGNTVTLKLSSAVTNGQVIDLSYMTGAAPLYDSLGNIIKSFSNLQVQNLTGGTTTTASGVQPDYLTAMSTVDFGVGGYQLNLSTAQASSSQSRYGISMKKYVIDNDKFQAAFKYLTDNNIASKRIVFEVPSTEKAAEVVIPMNALMTMYSSGKTGSFAVKYNNVMYDLPIEKIPYSEISRALSASSLTSAYITIQIEPIMKAQISSLNYSNIVTTAPITDPVQIYVSAYNETAVQNAVDVAHTGQIYFKAATSPSSMYVYLMKYDLAARTASFVPGKAAGNGSSLVFSGKVNGNSIVGPATGYSYFSDTAKHWAKADITELSSKLIVDARSDNKFEPDKNITRAEFAIFITKGLGLVGDASSANRFSDVTSGTNAAYIGAAAKAGIITGNTDGTFKPGSNITREQMALMMVRAMDYAGHNIYLNGSSAQVLTKFKDGAKIQSKETVAKAVKEGIIQGMTANTFQPQGNATRAQAAVMLKRVLDKLDYL